MFAICPAATFTFLIIYFSLAFFASDPEGADAGICTECIIAAFRALVSYPSIMAAIFELLFRNASAIWCVPEAASACEAVFLVILIKSLKDASLLLFSAPCSSLCYPLELVSRASVIADAIDTNIFSVIAIVRLFASWAIHNAFFTTCAFDIIKVNFTNSGCQCCVKGRIIVG